MLGLMELKIPTPRNFSFRRTVASHGWYQLPPFALETGKWQLSRVIDVGRKAPVTIFLTERKSHVSVKASRLLSSAEAAIVLRDARHILRLDDDLRAFYLAIVDDPEFAWIGQQGAGRLLRSPTVYEDLVKMMCTTNCSWALTLKMVNGLVNNLGRETNDGRRSFPNAHAMAAMPLKFFVDEVRAGYRAPYLKELAERVSLGELDVEQWLTSDVPTRDLLKQIKGVKGVGDYAAENLIKLLGRYDGLALDSWTRARFYELRNNGRKVNDKKIARYYARFNEWRGLALWCDVTRDWL
jgi:3-methyladenine DNA glycosylase/8-oxoguanine DNA glycosylase